MNLYAELTRIACTSLLVSTYAAAADIRTITVEEPTGLYRRTNEVAGVPLSKIGGHRSGWTVIDPAGKEQPWQVAGDELLFPASVVPGELPKYRLACCTGAQAPRFTNSIVLRKLGMRRVELGNSRFRVVIDTAVPAIVEAYSFTAAEHRSLNYVETTPEDPKALVGDIHESSPEAKTALPPPVAGIKAENTGWTSTAGSGAMTSVELQETGPLRGRLRLGRAGETWEFTWTAGSGALRWRARRGFRFTAISAKPYVPFDRAVGGSEYEWPSGPGSGEPPDRDVRPRDWTKLPGGHIVYYQAAENYGAFGIVALDGELNWRGAGSRHVIGEKADGETEIALTFPRWAGEETALEARRENRLVRQPLLVQVSGRAEAPVPAHQRAARDPEYESSNAGATPFTAEALSLDGDWELAWTEKGAGPPQSGWRRVHVPGSVHTQWLEPSAIYTRAAEWLSYKEWWYRRRFSVPPAFAGKRLRLHFEATDYYADTWLNGRATGRHEGYIDPYEYDVTDAVRAGEDNEILVRVWTPVSYYWKHRPWTVKGSYGAVDQKPDDITAVGVTRSVRLIAGGAAFIRDVAVNTRLTGEGAEVEVELASDGDAAAWELTLSPRNFSSPQRYQVRLPAPAGAARATIAVPDPQLWWTWDHGKPNLYTLDIRLLDARGKAIDGKSIAVGIREVEKIGWHFYLNRRRMFIRGTNYYYHLFMSEMTRAKYERDMELMLGMNVNMIRLHCHFSSPEFYDLADERGVLVWQDFLEAWYPHDRRFAQRAAELYDNHIRYVRNHPSIALWATSDEEDFENYRELTKHLAPRAALLDPQRRPVVRSTGRFGDSHVYHGWYDGSIWQYAGLTQQFVSELGATALPNYETLIKFMPDRWPIRAHAAEWTWRRLQIPEAMRAWGEPGELSLRDYIPKTQAYVARLFQLALERMRRRKNEGAGGILHFHAIDIWPSVTMAAIDFDRVPTKVYYTVRRSFAPVLASIEYDRDRWRSGEAVQCGIWAINDRWDAIDGASVRWTVRRAGGAVQAKGGWPVSMPADSAQKLGAAVWTAGEPGAYELRAEVAGPDGSQISENIFEFEVAP